MAAKNIMKNRKEERTATYLDNYKIRLSTFFKWSSDSIQIPYNMEILLRDNGSIGYAPKIGKWVIGTFNGIVDEFNDFTTYVCKTLETMPETYELTNHKDVIVCGNNAFYKSDRNNLRWLSQMDAENDISMYFQLVNSRNIPILVANNDKIKKQIEHVFEDIQEGKPVVITTDLMSQVEVKDIIDPKAIDKMECLTALHDDLLKRNMNMFGASLETKDKKAQVNNVEMMGFDDYTTLGFLANYEPRLSFCDEMKENGIDIECVRNPIFADEPTEEDIEEGRREDVEDENTSQEDSSNSEDTEQTTIDE